MTRTLVTGVAGFTGRYLAPLLEECGHEVHGLVHTPIDFPIAGVAKVHAADLADLSAVRRVVEEVRPHTVVHLAAIAFVAHDDVDALYRSNIVGCRQLLEALSLMTDRPKAVLIASSANIYGNGRAGILEEDMPPAPANDYGISKVAVECLANSYSDRLPCIVVRPFNYTGVGQSTNFIIPKIVEHARSRNPVIELGNLDVSRDFSDVRTIVDAYVRLLDEPGAVGGTFNVCSGHSVPLRDVIGLVQTLSGHSFEVQVNPAFVRANEVRSLWGSPARLESTVGPLSRIPLEETLRWMLEG